MTSLIEQISFQAYLSYLPMGMSPKTLYQSNVYNEIYGEVTLGIPLTCVLSLNTELYFRIQDMKSLFSEVLEACPL